MIEAQNLTMHYGKVVALPYYIYLPLIEK